jgi:xanthine dehydrogenase YagS FAD-binding subunit
MRYFDYKEATSVAEAAAIMESYAGKARIIAGGTDLLSELKKDILASYPEALINIKTIPNQSYIKEEGEMLKIGAMTALEDISNSKIIRNKYPALARASRAVAIPPIRRMGTLGGNLCQDVRCWYYRYPHRIGGRLICQRKGGTVCFAVRGDNRYHAIIGGKGCFAVCPSDTAVALTALNAKIVTSKRKIPIDDFFKVSGNDLAVNELVTEIQVPSTKPGTVQTFTKTALRKAMDFALVSVASAITVESGKICDARIVLGAVAPVPFRAIDAEALLKGRTLSDEAANAAAEAAVKNAMPLANNAYKVQIAKTLVKRAIPV